MKGLSDRERERYARQIVLPEWGEEGQLKVKQATVFVAGAGGLGSSAIFYLAAAGVGCIRVCDRGRIELANLNRQILHGERTIGMKKSVSAQKTVARLTRGVEIVPLAVEMRAENVGELAAGADILLDCLDNVPGRMVLNGLSVRSRIPMVHAGVRALCGQLSFLRPPATPCLACFMEMAAEGSGADGLDAAQGPPPILGATAGTMGCLQALEALKYITGIGERAENRLIFFDGETMSFEEVRIARNPGCPVCGREADAGR
jgi:bacteriocin biosynthesis cyclodehydratase domain-containing protein